MKKIEGLLAATLTPFHKNGELNLSVIDDYAKHLENDNIKGIFVTGTTGESVLLTVEERKKLAEKWVQTGKDRFDHIIIQVGTSNLKDSQELMTLWSIFVLWRNTHQILRCFTIISQLGRIFHF